MYLIHLFIIVSTIMCASSEMSDIEEMYLNFFVQIESVQKSIDILKLRVDAMSETSKNKQPYVDKETFDDLKAQVDAWKDNFKAKQQNGDSKMENSESQQIQKKSEMQGNYSNLLDELNTVKLSEKSCKEKYSDLEEKYLELLKNNENDRKSNNDDLSTANNTSQLKEKYSDLEEKYLELVKNKENESKSNNDLSLCMDNITSQLSNLIAYEVYSNKPLFDVRVDQLPEIKKKQCQPDSEPIDCKAATKCTQKSGYYKIYLPGNKEKQIMVFCDMKIAGGNWMHIFRRIDGSETFNRPWSDYVHGFGNVEGEYWIGLKNLNALTNNNGRQKLYVHLENPTNNPTYASYNNFLVGNATEIYKLKSLGTYEGPAADGLSYYMGQKFSTYDYDNDGSSSANCATHNMGGWWYNNCAYALPTGKYGPSGIRWDSRDSNIYNYKIINFMIRSFK